MLQAEHAPGNLPCFMVNNSTKNTEEQCKFIIDNDCLEDESTIDYVYLVFCNFSYDMKWAAIVVVLSLVVILFLNLSAVADEFLCPNLLTVAKNLRMSDSLAGVTLLAFGNGCPDIFSSLAAASSGRPEIIVGELLGAGIFCTSIVAGLIFIHSDFKVARRPLLRDATFYLLAVFLMWLYCYQGFITFYGSLAFIIIYVIYLFFALSGQAIHSRLRGEYPVAEAISRRHEKVVELEEEVSGQEDLEHWFRWREESLRRGSLVRWSECCKNEKNTLVLADNKTTIRISYQNPGQKPEHQLGAGVGDKIVSRDAEASWQPSEKISNCCQTRSEVLKCQINSHKLPPESANANVILKNSEKIASWSGEQKKRAIGSANEAESPSGQKFTMADLWECLKQMSPITADDWAEVNVLGKTILILRAPLLLLAILTVPVVNREKKRDNWNKLLNSIQCVTIPIAVIILLRLGAPSEDGNETSGANLSSNIDLIGRNDSSPTTAHIGTDSRSQMDSIMDFIPIRYALVLPGIVLGVFVFYSSSAHQAPKLHAAYSYFGFAMSVMWIYVLATEIISILKTVGIIFSMTDTAIGLGVLAWGNSLGDIVANLTLAEAGYARMALGASIGAPLLNLLLGFGLSFCVSLKPGESTQIYYSNTTALLAITLALVLGLLMLSTLVSGKRSKKPFGYLLISCYGIYFALAVCLECDLIKF